jgi:hypothetical protein
MTRGWVVTRNGQLTCFFPQWRSLATVWPATLFPTYERARNAMRMSQRRDKREGWTGVGYKIIRVERQA